MRLNTDASDNLTFSNQLRRTVTADLTFTGRPAAVFPLLCPVREYDWIPGWTCEMIYSDSGYAELGCVFRTRSWYAGPGGVPAIETWAVSRYEPNRSIGFVRMIDGIWVSTLDLRLAPSGEGTRCLATRMFTALTPAGAERLADLDEDVERSRLEGIAAGVSHYLTTGRMRSLD